MITVKEEWLTDDKTKRAIAAGGYEVVAMWLALKRYCAEHLTDGFIPDEDIDSLPGAPPKPRKALEALLNCGRVQRDGQRSPGLVLKVEHGWELHKYLEHANSREQEEQRRAKARARKERFQERRSERVPLAEQPEPENGVPDGVPMSSGTESPARGRAHAPSPAQPSPIDLPDTTIQGPDRLAPGPACVAGGGSEDSDRESLCPLDLAEKLEANGTVAQLAEHCRVSRADVSECLRLFVGTWTIGKLAGQRRRAWAGKARQWVLDQHAQGKLVGVAKNLGEGSGSVIEWP